MPYASAKQRAYMHSQLPSIAKRWDKEYGGKMKIKRTKSVQGMFGHAIQRRMRGNKVGNMARAIGGTNNGPIHSTPPANPGRSIPSIPGMQNKVLKPSSTPSPGAYKNLQGAITRRMSNAQRMASKVGGQQLKSK